MADPHWRQWRRENRKAWKAVGKAWWGFLKKIWFPPVAAALFFWAVMRFYWAFVQTSFYTIRTLWRIYRAGSAGTP